MRKIIGNNICMTNYRCRRKLTNNQRKWKVNKRKIEKKTLKKKISVKLLFVKENLK